MIVYPKTDGSRKSVYGKFKNEIVIDYNKGIDIQHVMASGTLPEFYKYAKVPIYAKDTQADEYSTSNPKKINGNNEDIRYFLMVDGSVIPRLETISLSSRLLEE